MDTHPAICFIRRFIPVTERYHEERCFVVGAGKRIATPLLLVLAVVENTDLLIAVDSIPAVILVFVDVKMLTEDWSLEGILHIHEGQMVAH